MIKTTVWKPDTHDCVIEYEWDDSLPEDQRTHTVKVIHNCPEEITGTNKQKFDKIVEENRFKNALLDHLKEDGTGLKFSYDKQRKLHVKGLKNQQKLNTFAEKSKVVLE